MLILSKTLTLIPPRVGYVLGYVLGQVDVWKVEFWALVPYEQDFIAI